LKHFSVEGVKDAESCSHGTVRPRFDSRVRNEAPLTCHRGERALHVNDIATGTGSDRGGGAFQADDAGNLEGIEHLRVEPLELSLYHSSNVFRYAENDLIRITADAPSVVLFHEHAVRHQIPENMCGE
jgi:hypothetical protein